MRHVALFVALATLSLIPSIVPASAGMRCPRDFEGRRIVVDGCGYNNGYYYGGYARPAPPPAYGYAPVYVERGPSVGGLLAGAVLGGIVGAIAADSYNNMQRNQQAPVPAQ